MGDVAAWKFIISVFHDPLSYSAVPVGRLYSRSERHFKASLASSVNKPLNKQTNDNLAVQLYAPLRAVRAVCDL